MRNLFFKPLLALTLLLGVISCQEDYEAAKVVSAFSNYDTEAMNREIYADSTTPLEIKFTVSEDWYASIEGLTDEGEWLSIDDASPVDGEAGDYTLTVTPAVNYTGEQRSARVDILSATSGKLAFVVRQTAASEDGTYPRNPALDFEYEGEAEVIGYADQTELGSFSFVAPASWEAQASEDWVVMSKESGTEGSNTIAFSSDNVNATGADKVATITLSVTDSSSDAEPITVTLIHKATTESGEAPQFDFEVDSSQTANLNQEIRADQTEYAALTFTAPAAWEATCEASWIDITSTSSGAKGEATLTFAANSLNTSGALRSTKITISVTDSNISAEPIEINLTQTENDESGSTLLFAFKDSSGAEITGNITREIDANQLSYEDVIFSAPATWSSDFSATWLTMSATSGAAGSNTITFAANNLNTTGSDRVATIKLSSISGDDSDEMTLVITQKSTAGGTPFTLSLTTVSELDFADLAYDGSESASISFDATYNWVVTSSPSWVTISQSSGDAGSGVGFTATPSANSASSSREGTIVVETVASDSDGNTKSLTYTLSQQADPDVPVGITMADFNAGGRYESENPEGYIWTVVDESHVLADFEGLAKAIERAEEPITLILPNLLELMGNGSSTVYSMALTNLKAIYMPEATKTSIYGLRECTGLELIYMPKVDTFRKDFFYNVVDLKTLVLSTDAVVESANVNANSFRNISSSVTVYTTAENDAVFSSFTGYSDITEVITTGYTGELPW